MEHVHREREIVENEVETQVSNIDEWYASVNRRWLEKHNESLDDFILRKSRESGLTKEEIARRVASARAHFLHRS